MYKKNKKYNGLYKYHDLGSESEPFPSKFKNDCKCCNPAYRMQTQQSLKLCLEKNNWSVLSPQFHC